MRSHRLTPLIAVVSFSMNACGPNVLYHRDSQTPIPGGARWAWGQPDDDGISSRAGGRAPSDSTAQLLRSAIELELDERGYRRTSRDSADFLVHFHVGRREVYDTLLSPADPSAIATARGRGRWSGAGSPETIGDQAVQWTEGKLIVDVVTPDGGKVAWRGEISDEIPPGTQKNLEKNIRTAIDKLMRGFP
ncbi:MAG TPA: DUF4136 domain-containing protein [Gemmatimonadaceae bacterium]|nr:DUF4136 domain-containing protein [Gemmatimonadaceae bacterium]